jgi:TorA-specific chaperone
MRRTARKTPVTEKPNTRAFSSEVDTGSRKENASNQESRAPFRFNRNGKSSSAVWRWLSAIFAAPLDDNALAICHAHVAFGAAAENSALGPGLRAMREAMNALPPGAAGTAKLARTYTLLFSGAGGPATIAPYESMFATTDGRLFGEPEARMRALLRDLDLHVASGPGEPADHVSIEFTVMAELPEDSGRRADLARRLDGWLGDFRDACAIFDETRFYAAAATLAAALAREESPAAESSCHERSIP